MQFARTPLNRLTGHYHGHSHPPTTDFWPAFIAIGMITALAFFVCLRLPHDAGAKIANRAQPAKAEPEPDKPVEEPRRKAS